MNGTVHSVSPAKRRYQLRRRAELQAETRRRIVDAAVQLHTTIGPARTTISAIAELAGVQRLTVYRHFPDLESLFMACTTRGTELWPMPDLAGWREVPTPEARLRRALAETYAYFRTRERGLTVIMRDAQDMPVVPGFLERRHKQATEAVATVWKARGRRRRLLLAAIGHALAFETWHSLVRGQGLQDSEAVELMVRLVRTI